MDDLQVVRFKNMHLNSATSAYFLENVLVRNKTKTKWTKIYFLAILIINSIYKIVNSIQKYLYN